MPTRKRVFSYAETLEMFPRVRDLTARAVQEVQALHDRPRSQEEMATRSEELEEEAGRIIEAWVSAIVALGCEVKGLWLVDWDCGDGYYCWRYPEEAVGFFHGYEDGFRGRVPIV